METMFLAVSAGLLIAAAAYAQRQVPAYTAGAEKVALTRAVLLAGGIAFGALWALNYPDEPLLAALAFLIGFGAVHLPAAVILFVKHERGAGKS